jgi:ABC-type transport system involved in multi-copper enzyme maturation permease subunit
MSPPRALLALVIVGFPSLLLLFAPQLGLHLLQSGAVLGMILGAGLIGQDVSSGVVQLLFARPVSRGAYVLSRWFAVGLCAAGATILQIALGGLVMALRGAPPGLGAIAGAALEQSLAAFGIVAVLTLLSSLLPGVGDILAWVLLNIAGGVLQMIGGLMRSPWMVRASEEWGRFLSPTLGLQATFGGGVISWFNLVSFLSTVSLCLALAIVILNRREFSYATD